MAEKAELLEQLQVKDHVVMQLSGETETIGQVIYKCALCAGSCSKYICAEVHMCAPLFILKMFVSIGEYISLYQLQRQALKSKFMENDRFVQQVMAEKASMQV